MLIYEYNFGHNFFLLIVARLVTVVSLDVKQDEEQDYDDFELSICSTLLKDYLLVSFKITLLYQKYQIDTSE